MPKYRQSFPDYGSRLLGSVSDGRRTRRVRIQVLVTGSILLSNTIGAILAITLASVGIPEPSTLHWKFWWINFIALPVYVVSALLIGAGIGTTLVVRQLQWAIRDQRPTARQRRHARRTSLRLAFLQAVFWLGATIMFTLCFGILDPMLIPKIFFVIAFSGVVVCSTSYLLTEFALRPVAAQVLSMRRRHRRRPGALRIRSLTAWLVGSGIPLTGIVLVVAFAALNNNASKASVFISVIVLAAIALGTGLLLNHLNTAQVIAPVRTVRRGMDAVRAGNTDVDVVIFDGTELGELQAGFNDMVAGLRERERARDLFGRHVGKEVAAAALASDPELGGVERVVAALFIDVMGSTTLASERSPTEVVSILNQFFAVIVDEVERHRGLVNKFEGDAVLAIFGAPLELDDAAGAALASARAISTRLVHEVPDVTAGIGVGYGPAVAGNVGAIERFEYTVIGDPVNESARLSELAKRDPRVPLASGRATAAANTDEAAQWQELESVQLRGRVHQTAVFGACDGDSP